jgi:hypothetical protein
MSDTPSRIDDPERNRLSGRLARTAKGDRIGRERRRGEHAIRRTDYGRQPVAQLFGGGDGGLNWEV